MLNPSTADATADDPTIRRCMGFTRRWGLGELAVVNLFAYRATCRADLMRAREPIGPENNSWIARAVASADRVVLAWGASGSWRRRDERVLAILDAMDARPRCLGLTRDGSPRHPLYLRSDSRPRRYPGARRAHASCAAGAAKPGSVATPRRSSTTGRR